MTKEELSLSCKEDFDNLNGLTLKIQELASSGKGSYALEETAAIGAFLFSAYSGIERVLERILLFEAFSLKGGEEKHAEILKKALELGILPQELYSGLSRYLAFREFFCRSYVTQFNHEKVAALAQGFNAVLSSFEKELREYIDTI
ncbi:MAG: hypothetical protein M0Z59_08190 [Nitrospiraceae bacterium]|nr:hypothetical protein [Nitrospiraceae bacterium]